MANRDERYFPCNRTTAKGREFCPILDDSNKFLARCRRDIIVVGKPAQTLSERERKPIATHNHIADILAMNGLGVEYSLQQSANLGMAGCDTPELLR